METTTVCYIKGLGRDEKRQSVDSSKQALRQPGERSNRLVNFTAVDRSLTGLWWS